MGCTAVIQKVASERLHWFIEVSKGRKKKKPWCANKHLTNTYYSHTVCENLP